VKWFNPTKAMDSSNRKAAGRMCLCTFLLWKKQSSTLNDGQQVEFEIVSNRGILRYVSWSG